MFGLFRWRKTLYSDGEIDLSLSPGGFLETGDGVRDGYTFDICLRDQRKPAGARCARRIPAGNPVGSI